MVEAYWMIAMVMPNSSIFKDSRLAKKLLYLILLSRDQEERRACLVDEIFANLFPQVLRVNIFSFYSAYQY